MKITKGYKGRNIKKGFFFLIRFFTYIHAQIVSSDILVFKTTMTSNLLNLFILIIFLFENIKISLLTNYKKKSILNGNWNENNNKNSKRVY